VVAVPFVSWLRMRGKFRLFPIVLLAGFLAAIPDLAITLGGFGAFGHLNDEWGNHLVLDGRLTWLGVLRLLVVRPICYWVLGATGGLVFWSIAKEQPGSTRAEIAI